jgi:hypothetical protein
MTSNKKLVAVFITLALTGGVFAASTRNVRAAAVIFDPLEELNEFIIKPLVRKIANSLESKLTNKVNKLISNINGQVPSFVTNWRNYVLDSQGRGNDIFRSMLADVNACSHFSKNLKTAFGADKAGALNNTVKNSSGAVVYQNKLGTPGMTSFKSSASCTMSPSVDIKGFNTNFKGGWGTWNQLIQPQNNIFGTIAGAFDAQSAQISIERTSALSEATAGNGFLSQRLGVGGSGLGPTGCTGDATPRYRMDENGKMTLTSAGTANARCMFMGQIMTPSKVLGESAANSLDTKMKRVGGASYLTDIILSLFAAVVDGTTSRLANFIGQNTYDRPASTPEPFNFTNEFNPVQFNGGAGDPNFDAQHRNITNNATASCQQNCTNQGNQQCDDQYPNPLDKLLPGYTDCKNNVTTSCQTQCQNPNNP